MKTLVLFSSLFKGLYELERNILECLDLKNCWICNEIETKPYECTGIYCNFKNQIIKRFLNIISARIVSG